MANGKLGDHPLTDVQIHKKLTFSAEVDCLILDCTCLVDKLIVTGKMAKRIYWYGALDQICDWFNPPPLDEIKRRLLELKAKLQAELDSDN